MSEIGESGFAKRFGSIMQSAETRKAVFKTLVIVFACKIVGSVLALYLIKGDEQSTEDGQKWFSAMFFASYLSIAVGFFLAAKWVKVAKEQRWGVLWWAAGLGWCVSASQLFWWVQQRVVGFAEILEGLIAFVLSVALGGALADALDDYGAFKLWASRSRDQKFAVIIVFLIILFIAGFVIIVWPSLR